MKQLQSNRTVLIKEAKIRNRVLKKIFKFKLQKTTNKIQTKKVFLFFPFYFSIKVKTWKRFVSDGKKFAMNM